MTRKATKLILFLLILLFPVLFTYFYIQPIQSKQLKFAQNDYFFERVSLLEQLVNKELEAIEIHDSGETNNITWSDSCNQIVLVVKPSGCTPCVNKSIDYYRKTMTQKNKVPIIIGCFENNRHAMVWIRDHSYGERWAYILPAQIQFSSESPLFMVINNGRIITVCQWSQIDEEFSVAEIDKIFKKYDS